MKILLLGKNGQVGWELQRALAPLGELIALDRHGSDSLCGDLERLDALADTVQRLAPDLVVNAAAYTAVDQAESDAERARRINADAVGVLAGQATELGALLVDHRPITSSMAAASAPGAKTTRRRRCPSMARPSSRARKRFAPAAAII